MAASYSSVHRDLTSVPLLTHTIVESTIKENACSLGTNEMSKGYKYFCEKYIQDIKIYPDGVGCVVKAKCHRSMKKNESPHDVEVLIKNNPVQVDIHSCVCSCAIGRSGTCGHVTGLLYTLAHLKASGASTIPIDVAKTSLPQTWHMPRGEKLKPSKVEDVVVRGYDQQNPSRQTKGIKSTLANPITPGCITTPPVQVLLYKLKQQNINCMLESIVEPTTNVSQMNVMTKFGNFPKGCCVSVQQKFSTMYCINILDADEFPHLPASNVMINNLSTCLNEEKQTHFKSINMNVEEVIQVEEMTRLQSDTPKWHAVRRDRITASIIGDIAKRRADFAPLVIRLNSTRKVVTESMRHGIACEPLAAQAYSQFMDNEVNVYPCGIIVSPYAPWIAASPDRKIFCPKEDPCYGLLEIKCPVLELSDCKYLHKEGDRLVLKTNHNYYYQIMCQMAVTGLKWCHFFVWRDNESHFEKISFDPLIWSNMKDKLDIFYFDHFL